MIIKINKTCRKQKKKKEKKECKSNFKLPIKVLRNCVPITDGCEKLSQINLRNSGKK